MQHGYWNLYSLLSTHVKIIFFIAQYFFIVKYKYASCAVTLVIIVQKAADDGKLRKFEELLARAPDSCDCCLLSGIEFTVKNFAWGQYIIFRTGCSMHSPFLSLKLALKWQKRDKYTLFTKI